MLTILMATYNGSQTLPKVFDACLGLASPRAGWQMVIVDNASSDDTQHVVESYTDRLPITLVEEPRRGKNRALNTGLEYVRGDLVVFMDDDVIPDRDWLVRMRDTADEQSEFSIFGGQIDPIWPSEPPDWLFRVVPLGVTFAAISIPIIEGQVSPRLIWGGNMAIRSSVFVTGHRFDESVGPLPGQYRMGGETEFTERLGALGHKAWHCAARVGHIIRPEQMDPEWIVGRAFRLGRALYHEEHAVSVSMLFGVPRWRLRLQLETMARFGAAKLTGNFEKEFTARWEANLFRGYLAEARLRRH
jgi:L-malate glycosyltransferase